MKMYAESEVELHTFLNMKPYGQLQKKWQFTVDILYREVGWIERTFIFRRPAVQISAHKTAIQRAISRAFTPSSRQLPR